MYDYLNKVFEDTNVEVFRLITQYNIIDCEECIVSTCCEEICQKVAKQIINKLYG